MSNTFWIAMVTRVAAAALTTLDIATIRRFATCGKRDSAYFMCFAAGVLVAATFLHMVPRAFAMNPQAPDRLLAGFLGLHLFNHFLTAFVCQRVPAREDIAIGVLPMIGIGLHSFIDGFVYSIAYTVSVLTGFLATLGMVLHEFPEGIVTSLLLRHAGFGERRAAIFAFAAAAVWRPS